MKVKCLLIGVVVLFVAGVLTASTYAKIDPKTIVGLWLLDEGKGDVATDSSGNKNDGAFKGSPKWVAGKFGSALELDGSSSYVDCGNTDTLDLPTSSSVTMCAWIKSVSGSTGSWRGVMAKRDANYSYGINYITNAFQVYTTGGSGIAGFAYNVPKGEWIHVAGTMSKNPTQLYINGDLFGTTGNSGGIFSNAGNLFRIGASFNNGEIFDGIIDEVAVFNTVLSADDIKTIATKGLGSATGMTPVEPSGKLATTWAVIKAQ
jgi:hypothetical protein